jgi:hypothetical protein
LLALALLALLAGCGGDEQPGKAAYERAFNAAREDFSERVRALDQPGRDAPAEERAAAGEQVAAEISRFVDELEAIEPPPDAAAAHADLTAAFQESADLTAEAAQAVREGDDAALRAIERRLSDRSSTDKRAEDAVQVLVEQGYVLDLDFELGR